MLTGAAAASAATALTPLANSPASAAAPLATTQAPGWYRYKVGSYQITVVTDGKQQLQAARQLRAQRQEGPGERGAARRSHGKGHDDDPVHADRHQHRLQAHRHRHRRRAKPTSTAARASAASSSRNLKAAGIDRDKVDTVIISHFHGDHINGLIKPDGSPAFPNAEILVPAVEWKYFMDDGEMSRQTTDRMKGVFAGARTVFDALKRKVTQYEPARRWRRASLRSPTYGHTPGHMSYVVASGGKTSTCSPTSPTIRRCSPAIRAGMPSSTRIPQMAEATRRKVYDMLVADKMMVQGFHYPFPSVAYVEKAGSGYREIPVTWNSSL